MLMLIVMNEFFMLTSKPSGIQGLIRPCSHKNMGCVSRFVNTEASQRGRVLFFQFLIQGHLQNEKLRPSTVTQPPGDSK